MKIDSKDFRVREGDAVNLKKWPTPVEPVYESKKHYKQLLEDHVAQLSACSSFTTHPTVMPSS